MNRPSSEQLFHEVRKMTPEARAAHLARRCGNDDALRAEVDALLEAEADAGSFLADATEGRASGCGDQADRADSETKPRRSEPGGRGGNGHSHGAVEQPGQMIGRYKLLQRIGEGGFGSVWMAEQREPVRRRVALKVIKLGMDTGQVIARFEAERQALAMMDHPNIAKVLDAGSTDTGRPYFVMEYIRGTSIVEYCDGERLDTQGRLDLFTMVCHAIQHAHQKGIIHRDIKPNNVLVTLHDGVPVPKVIDFGIAKATSAELTTRTLFTQHRQMVGTPAYMSPEQAEMSGLDIDTRSDVYSLGVLLYELLTGTTPFDAKSLLEAGFAEMLRIIREQEPPTPSTRLATLGDTGARTALHRRTDLRKLGTLLRGDLDWIVMKCLEKDRSRRYETANALAADIQRHLNDEPVVAGPPSAAYRMRKFARRNRAAVLAASLIAATLLLGAAGTTGGMFWALHQKARAEAAEQATTHELGRATEVKRLITEMLASISPEEAKGADITLLKSVLDAAAARLEQGDVKDELIAAELHHLIGGVYSDLARQAEAEEHLLAALEARRRLLGADHSDTINSMIQLAKIYSGQGRYDAAEALCRDAYETARKALGDSHPQALTAMNALATQLGLLGREQEAEEMCLQAIALLDRTEPSPSTVAGIQSNLGMLYRLQGRYAEAEQMLLRAVEARKSALGIAHPDTIRTMEVLANGYQRQGRLPEAEALCDQALKHRLRIYGDEHPATLSAMGNLARIRHGQGRLQEAELLYVKTLELQRSALGEEHPDALKSMNNLAMFYQEQHRIVDAEPLRVKSLEIARRTLGSEHPITLACTANTAALRHNQGKFDEAALLYRETIEILKLLRGPEHPNTLIAMHNLATLYDEVGRYDDAEALYLETIELRRRALGPEHQETLSSLSNLASMYAVQKRYAEAEPLRLTLLETQRRTLGPEHPDVLATMTNLGILYSATDRYEQALAMLETSLPIKRRVLARGHPWTRSAIEGLATTYEQLGRRDDALPLRAELLEMRFADASESAADSKVLRDVARACLTSEYPELRDADRALQLAKRACEQEQLAGGGSLWQYLDTLALAQHMAGDAVNAASSMKRAISIMPDTVSEAIRSEYEARLRAFEQTLEPAGDAPSP